MCGLAGVLGDAKVSDESLRAMAFAIHHRGPNHQGVWRDAEAGIGLGHARLSILDLSSAGHQPMRSASGRYVIVYNGEIYNHALLRTDLEKCGCAPDWRGHSDTETLLAGFDAWGIEATTMKTVGMFAFAVWDKEERTLTLARDRMGEKPLYFGWNRGVFLFASELKALRAYPCFDSEINRNTITLLLRHSYIPAPYSIYQGIFKLWPGTLLTMGKGNHRSCPWDVDRPPFQQFQGDGISLRPYWTLRNVVEQGRLHPFGGTENEAVTELEHVLTSAVLSQQISDVPLGAFLSGGVDSSTIVALMQAHAARPIKTFTIGFHEDGYNEAKFAKDVARHLGTEHTEFYVSPEESMAVIPRLPTLYDEPFSDASQIPTFLVSQLARPHVTVSLSGDAGDELLGGYDRYLSASAIWKKIGWLPRLGRSTLAHAIKKISPSRFDQLDDFISWIIPGKTHSTRTGDRALKLADLLSASDREFIYKYFFWHWKSPGDVVICHQEPPTMLTNSQDIDFAGSFENKMMYLDAMSYLPDDILVKVDRAAMGVSLETRVPFLDHRVIEFAWRLPLALKIRNGQGKWILRQVLYKYVPKQLIDRPKAGFCVPIDSWLRGSLKEWAGALLEEGRLKREGYFNAAPIRQKWTEHLSGQRNWQYDLWDVLMFQAWLESNT
jgi:asparagine synthase (glutamine-hydrolysing)